MPNPRSGSDSAGFPWEGRTFDHHGTAFADDDGTSPQAVVAAIAQVRSAATRLAQAATAAEIDSALDALADSHGAAVVACAGERFLIPLVAEAGDYGVTDAGKVVEKSQELSIVTVAAPDGRKALPVFTSVEAMQRWDPSARPIPVPGPQVAIAAAEEATDLVIVDPGSTEGEFGIRRPALEAFALAKTIRPAWADSDVSDAFAASVASESAVTRVMLVPGDPTARLMAAEVRVGLYLQPGLDRDELDALLTRLQRVWAEDALIASKVDSMTVQVRQAA